MITTVASLMGFALAGIIIMQFFWIRHALKVSGEQFDRSVNEALNVVVQRLEKRENVLMVTQKLVSADCQEFTAEPASPESPLAISKTAGTVHKIPGQKHVIVHNTDTIYLGQDWNFNNIPEYFAFPPVPDYEHLFDQSGAFFPEPPGLSQNISINIDSVGQVLRQLTSIFMVSTIDTNFNSFGKDHEIAVTIQTETNEDKQAVPQKDAANRRIQQKARKVNEAIRQVAIDIENIDRPLEKRIDTVELKKELTKSFSDRGIDLAYDFGITMGLRDSLTKLKSGNFTAELIKTPYRVSLFPAEIIEKPDFLLVNFPLRNRHIFKSVSLMMAASGAFTLMIIFAFISSVVIMLRQKKLSDVKNDFINNMTHEFKTPIATISLAVDSINNSRVINEPELIKSYTKVIREENTRMNKHVEQVLQMAMMDRHEIKLNIQQVDIHELIDRAVEHLRLQVENRNGYILKLLEARYFMVKGDDLHLFNMIMNLLDNANKYSPSYPEIRITTINTGNELHLSVEDHGIGMSREAQKHIFEKFYRVPTGNLHAIKGFGLGLSYVKAITEAHHGSIQVKTETGKGSTFTVILPFTKDEFDNVTNTAT